MNECEFIELTNCIMSLHQLYLDKRDDLLFNEYDDEAKKIYFEKRDYYYTRISAITGLQKSEINHANFKY